MECTSYVLYLVLFMLDLLHNIIITNWIVEVTVHEEAHCAVQVLSDANWVKYGCYSKL